MFGKDAINGLMDEMQTYVSSVKKIKSCIYALASEDDMSKRMDLLEEFLEADRSIGSTTSQLITFEQAKKYLANNLETMSGGMFGGILPFVEFLEKKDPDGKYADFMASIRQRHNRRQAVTEKQAMFLADVYFEVIG